MTDLDDDDRGMVLEPDYSPNLAAAICTFFCGIAVIVVLVLILSTSHHSDHESYTVKLTRTCAMHEGVRQLADVGVVCSDGVVRDYP